MTTPIGPWPLGIDNVSGVARQISNEEGAPVSLVDAVNVDIDRDGRPARRAGHTLVAQVAGLHSLWSGKHGAFGVQGDVLVALPGMEPLATLASADPCTYAEVNGAVIVANRTTLLRVAGGRAEPLGVPDAPPATVLPAGAGGMRAGRYGVAVSFVSDQGEGGLSPLRFIQIEEGGGLLLQDLPTSPGATGLRIYRTHENGAVLYLAAEVPLGFPSYNLGNMKLGVAADTQHLRQMPPGEFVAMLNGFLLVAHGNVIRFSEPMRYGLWSPRHGFVQLPDRITMLAAVGNAVFVGTRSGVTVLRGAKPREWELDDTGARPPIPRAATYIQSGDTRTEVPGRTMAVWLAPNGFVMGTEDGQVIEMQTNRVDRIAHSAGAICLQNRRVTAVVA